MNLYTKQNLIPNYAHETILLLIDISMKNIYL